MKKVTLFLTACVIAASMISCNQISNTELEKPISVADSSSSNTALTREKIASVLDELRISLTSKTLSASEDVVPLYMSTDRVEMLTAENHTPYEEEFIEYEEQAHAVLEALFKELPDICVVDEYYYYKNLNYAPVDTVYYILDPNNVPDAAEVDIKAFLEYELYEAIDDSLDGKEGEQNYGNIECYDNIGTVAVMKTGAWYYLDTETNTLEEIELFSGYSEVRKIFGDINYKINQAKLSQELLELADDNLSQE